MSAIFFPGKLAAVLLAACLFLPSHAAAEFNPLPFDKSEELAPGFNACMKQAKSLSRPDGHGGQTTYMYYDAAVKCYMEAYNYWNDIFETEYNNIVNDKEKMDMPCAPYCLLPRFQRALKKYLEETSNLVGGDGGLGADLYSTRAYAEETKRVVKMLRFYGIFEKPETNALQESIMNSITRED